ncbi:MAG: glycosyltransferase family 4 protein [Patescibacteria group bacterium]|nr:MAG: glycosyltransferase family 4 protein [Patescibacteria group bacterium]
MKLLLVTYEYPPDRGGIASYLGGLFGAMENVTVLKLKQPRAPLAWLKDLPKMVRAARKADVVVISHLLPLGTAAMLLGKPYVVIVHGLDLRLARRKKALASLVLKKAKRVVANSASTAAALPEFGMNAERAVVLTPAIDASWDRFASKSRTQGLQKTILSVGRFVPRKGFDRLIGMLPKLREACGEVLLILAGAGPEEGSLRKEAEKLGVASHVKFVIAPDQETLAAQYWVCDVFALPARESKDDVEGFGIVFLEAALFGKPIVAMRTGGTPEAVQDSVTGLLADPSSEQEFLEKLIRVLNEPETAERLGDAGRERVLREFQWKERAELLKRKLA